MNKPYAIEFVTTACLRPDIFRRTLTSFYENLGGVDWNNSKLYLNLDPLPDYDSKKKMNRIGGMISIANEFFGSVKYNCPKQGNLTAALQWGVMQVEGPLFFHLQDDFVLTVPVDIRELAPLISKRWSDPYFNGPITGSQIVQVCLRVYKTIRDQRLCLTPAICSTRFFQSVCSSMNTSINPEVQIRPKDKINVNGVMEHQCKAVHWPDKTEIVNDIGRDWLVKQRLQRNAGRNDFTTWKKKGMQ